MNFIDYISEVGYPIKLIDQVIKNKKNYVYNLFIKGKLQTAPKWELKIIQKVLKDYLEEYYLKENISNNATAYIKKTNISLNVNRHQGNSYFFVTDFKNFFPSISKDVIEEKISHILKQEDYTSQKYILEIIQFQDKLQYGFPTSPIISNLIMNEFDETLNNILIDKFKNDNIQYTRYADDITISSKYKIEKNKLKTLVINLIQDKYPFLKINEKKTRSFEKYAKNPHITGLIPLNKRNTIGKKKINKLKLNIYLLLKKREINNNDFYKTITSINSYLSYLYIVDKHNYNRLKYYFSDKYNEKEIKEIFKK